MTSSSTTIYFINKANKKHNYKYDYSKTIYEKAIKKIIIICELHGEFSQTPNSHLNGRGCFKCGIETSRKTRLINKEVFLDRLSKIFGTDRKFILPDEVTTASSINTTCEKHGNYKIKLAKLLIGKECPKCQIISRALASRLTKEEYLDKFNKINNYKYTYDLSNLVNKDSLITVICHSHGEYKTRAELHKIGQGQCQSCVRQELQIHFDSMRKSTEDFIFESNKIHNNKYDYSKSIYLRAGDKIEIICPIHGSFYTTPSVHLLGCNCPECSLSIVSKPETSWLDLLEIPKENRNQKLKLTNKYYNVDGIDIKNKTIYEFYGDYWHGNPNVFDQNKMNPSTKTTYGYLYQKTLNKEADILTAGYKMCIIWEEDFYKLGLDGSIWK
jgi:hypothetical protein